MMNTFITQIKEISTGEAFNKIKNVHSEIDSCKDLTKEYKASGSDLLTFIANTLRKNKNNNIAFTICIKRPEMESKVKNIYISPAKSEKSRTWITKYLIETAYNNEIVGKKDKKSEANAFAKDYSLRNKVGVNVYITKELKESNSLITKVRYNKSQIKTMGEWLFFGYQS